MLDLMPTPALTEIPSTSPSPIPSHEGLLGSGRGADLGKITFEDYFPQIDLDDDEKVSLAQWFERDLRSCVKNVNSHRFEWAKYRAVYLLEYIEKFYPDMGLGADFSSGLLCEKVLEGMDRMKRSIFRAYPLFGPDFKTTGSSENIEFYHRAQWCLHTMLENLGIADIIGDVGFFDFLIDGSMILEADTMYEKIPQRTLKTYVNIDDLMMDEDKVLDPSRLEAAYEKLQTDGVARVVVEEDVVTKSGLQFFHVDKIDHLIPEGVYSDRDIRFRARRMYFTSSDLRLMATDDVGWYDKDVVEEIIEGRNTARSLRGMASGGDENAREQLRVKSETYDLAYQWQREDDELKAQPGTQPYQEVFAVYRILGKYGYRTKSDPEGMIPKFCLFDFSPEGRKILRAVTYPHFKERPNYFHFKFGYAPDSYYGFGYGARVMQDDFLESNAVSLFMESAALATFNPFIFRHPDAGGRFPFAAGYGPGKIGYANDPNNDFKQVQVASPSDSLLRHVLPLTQTRTANRTNITSLVQGRTESSDPRSPAQKAALLLGQASVGLDVMVDDWSRTGWVPLADFVWRSAYEQALFALEGGSDVGSALEGLVVRGELPGGSDNKVTLEELKRDIKWKSMASADYLNPQVRLTKFMQHFMFFKPMLDVLAQIQPELYKIYFLRWMRRAAQEMEVPGADFLLPTQQEIRNMPADKLQGTLENIMTNMRAGQIPGIQVAGPKMGGAE